MPLVCCASVSQPVTERVLESFQCTYKSGCCLQNIENTSHPTKGTAVRVRLSGHSQQSRRKILEAFPRLPTSASLWLFSGLYLRHAHASPPFPFVFLASLSSASCLGRNKSNPQNNSCGKWQQLHVPPPAPIREGNCKVPAHCQLWCEL